MADNVKVCTRKERLPCSLIFLGAATQMSRGLHISSSRVTARLGVLGQVPRDQFSSTWTRTQEVIQSPSGMQRIGASDCSSQQGLTIGRAYSRDNRRAFQVGQVVGTAGDEAEHYLFSRSSSSRSHNSTQPKLGENHVRYLGSGDSEGLQVGTGRRTLPELLDSLISTEAENLLEKGAVTRVSNHSEGFYSRIFLVPKKGGQFRP